MTHSDPPVPDDRIRVANRAPVRPERDLVLYWMIAARRARRNAGLQRAVELAVELGKPLVVLEALRCDYRWASDRLHAFVVQGMAANRRAFAGARATYWPYVEPERAAGKGLLEALASRACAVVTDEFPCFFLPRMVRAAAERLDVRLEVVDSNGLIPLAAAGRAFPTAHSYRRFVQKNLLEHLARAPRETPLDEPRLPPPIELPDEIAARWPATDDAFSTDADALARLPIDHDVAPVDIEGGAEVASDAAERFVRNRLSSYPEERNHPDLDASSGLSPWLHFGHLSAHEVLSLVIEREGWTPDDVADDAAGKREGWWGTSPEAEAFLDQLVTWRELGYHFCRHVSGYDAFESLPDWARATLEGHAFDPREHAYTLADFEHARTHDDLWNAAQRQLLTEGRMHNYARMLWGKKVLHWTRSPREALQILIELNNKYALDGRDPNSYSGIAWCLGRFDRPWGPERAVFGKVRYMTTASAKRKLRLSEYLDRYGERGLLA